MRRNVFLWVLYDFANSFTYIAFFLYFSQWIVVDCGISDVWFNLCLAISSFFLLLTAPFIGVMLDKKWRNITGLRLSTLATIIFYSLAVLFIFYNEKVLSLIFFTIGQYFFVLSFVFYTPLLSVLSEIEKRGKVSGYGMAGNFLGNVSALFLALPFATGKIGLLGKEPRAETILPLLAVSFLFSLPMLLFFREPVKNSIKIPTEKSAISFAQTKLLFLNRNVLLFLVSFIFLNGAILTFINNSPIILDNLWQVPDITKTFILLIAIIASVFGSITGGYFIDCFGSKKTLIYITIGWIIMMPISALISTLSYYIVASIITGFLLGANMTTARVLMSNLAPLSRHNLAFAYFTIIEKTSMFVGPILWGLIVSGFMVLGPWRYRLAIISMALLIVLSLPILLKVKDTHES